MGGSSSTKVNTNKVNTSRVNTSSVNTNKVDTSSVNTSRVECLDHEDDPVLRVVCRLEDLQNGSSSTKVNTNKVNTSRVNTSSVNTNKVDTSSVNTSRVECLDHEDDPVLRVVCRLEDLQNIDILVNSTDRSLELNAGGEISKIILRLAGLGIQNELTEKYPNGMRPGDIAVSKGHGLTYDYVYHCSLQNIRRRISHHEIREVVTKCLQEAVEMFEPRQPSIAFPVLGTGRMKFHPRIIKTIYCAILEFMVENPNTVELAVIIIHPEKQELIDYAQTIDPEIEEERLTFQVPTPLSWSQSDTISRIPLSRRDDEYRSTVKHFRHTIQRYVHIIQIERIENKRLYVAFERYKNLLPEDQRTPKRLWHGTAHTSIDGITRYGFDWRLTERAKYGQGCYFAKQACFSDNDTYSKPNENGEKCIILAHVLVGNCIKGNVDCNEGNMPSNEQTTVNDLQNPTIFVTYDDDQVYPAFLVVYE